MAELNLLPWREERRQARRKEFLLALALVAATACLALFASDRYVSHRIEQRNAANDQLRGQIARLDRELEEISRINEQQDALAQRIAAIQELQRRRPLMVRLLDELARILPTGVYYDSISGSGDLISFSGAALSNNGISALLRALEESPLFDSPDLKQIAARAEGAPGLGNGFQLTALVAASGGAAQDAQEQFLRLLQAIGSEDLVNHAD